MPDKPRTMLVVLSDIAPELESDFLRWYDEEHIPQRLAVPGFRRAARFQAGPPPVSGSGLEVESPPRHLAVYEMDSVEVLESEPYRRLIANPTEWTRRIRSTFSLRLRHPYVEQFGLTDDDPRVDRFR
ncbi:MAG: hypothetical protein E6I08_00840 [Chloroflexi bacterium]|nr:MAG: hypothetical protein E6I08_00840 [Chloroflexota bacterium]